MPLLSSTLAATHPHAAVVSPNRDVAATTVALARVLEQRLA